MVHVVLSLSLLLQLFAIYFALRLIPITGHRLAWWLIALAIALMEARRAISFVDILSSGKAVPRGDLTVEVVALIISALMAVGIARVTPIFREIRSIADRLRESEDRFRALYETSPDAVVIVDSETGRVVELNQRALSLIGLSRKSVIGRDLSQLEEFDTTGEIGRQLKTAWNGSPSPTFESAVRSPDKAEIPVEVSLHVAYSGDVKLLQAIIRDITARIYAEKQREELKQQLLQTQKMESIGRLAGGLAHDFNNMLGVIIGFTELAQQDVSPEETNLNRSLQEIHSAARRSADLTRQLLGFARKQPTIPEVIDLNKSVEVMQKMLRRMISEDITLTWLPGKEVWPVRVDPSQLDQILANLCVNARDAITGAGHISIETANESLDAKYCARHPDAVPGDYVRLSVRDDGSGMDRDTLTKIFEPFFTTKEFGEGTGLGLATVYGIVEQNKGCIDVESEPGRGTVFNIYFPRHHGDELRQREGSRTGPFVHGHGRILLVEDEAAILEVATIALKECGYSVLPARSPEEATQIANEHADEIDMLITDIIMPGMNGRVLADKLSSILPRMRCLFMSGYSGDDRSDQGIVDDGIHIIQKPFTIADLTARVREVLDER